MPNSPYFLIYLSVVKCLCLYIYLPIIVLSCLFITSPTPPHSLFPLPLIKSQRLLLSPQSSRVSKNLSEKETRTMEDDWDLNAIVRGCTTTTTTNKNGGANSAKDSFCYETVQDQVTQLLGSTSTTGGEQGGQVFSAPDPFQAKNPLLVGDLHDLYKPFFPLSQILCSPTTQITTLSNESTAPNQQQQQQQQRQPFHVGVNMTRNASTSNTNRSKKRKNQMKRVCHVPALALSSDVWAWRKYGQKPIKGSPYPRGYYRCSSFKGCMARKQVERDRSDSGMYVITYTGEHNHPAPTHKNSLAGSTRQKTITTQTVTPSDPNKPSLSPSKPNSSSTSSESPVISPEQVEEDLAPQRTNSESREIMEDDDGGEEENEQSEGFWETGVNDDFFMGLEEFDIPVIGEPFSNNFPASFGLPNWLVNNGATAAGGV